MFQSFRVDAEDITVSRASRASGFNIEDLEKLLISSEPIDAEVVAKVIFPGGVPDVFLSHSHTDVEKATHLAVEMENLGLKVFIDSEIWGSVFDLLKKIDERFCYQETSRTFNYDYRNITTSNTFMILNSALIKMIDKAEIFMFVGSSNSLVFDSTKNLLDEDKTYSPWIHSELLFSSMARVTVPDRFKRVLIFDEARIKTEASLEAEKPRFIHPADTKHLLHITSDKLVTWLESRCKGVNALNKLYEITHVNTQYMNR